MNLAYHPTHLREIHTEPAIRHEADPRAHFCYCCWGRRMATATHWDTCFEPQIPCCNECAADQSRTCRMPLGSLRVIA